MADRPRRAEDDTAARYRTDPRRPPWSPAPVPTCPDRRRRRPAPAAPLRCPAHRRLRCRSHAGPARRAAARQRRNRRRGWVALLLVLMLTAVAALAGWYVAEGPVHHRPGIDLAQPGRGEPVAAEAGWSSHFDDEFSETVPKGRVMSTDPGPAPRSSRAARLEAAVSKGPERYTMPTVVGLSQQAAETALGKPIWRRHDPRPSAARPSPKGFVISASVAGRRTLKREAPSI